MTAAFVSEPTMDASRRSRSDTMNKTKSLSSSSKTLSSSTKTAPSRVSGSRASSRASTRAYASGRSRLSSASARNKVPIGKLLSVPEKREKGVLDDDGIDDAEEKAANARPRRAVPERRPREPNDPRSSVLTPTGAFAARDAPRFSTAKPAATAGRRRTR